MNKVQKFTLTAIFSLAAALAFSCSPNDDDDSSLDMDGASSSSEANASTPSSSSDLSTPSGSSSSADESSSSSDNSSSSVSFSDKGNDISNYKTVVIGDQTWMAENLNYEVEGGKCYGEEGGNSGKTTIIYGQIDFTEAEIQANCDKYGRLYDWAAAMALPSNCNERKCASQIQAKHQGICPSGWHIPSDAEWDALFRYADDGYNGAESPYESYVAGRYLKAMSGWNDYIDYETENEEIKSGNGLDTYGFAALPGGSGRFLPDRYGYYNVGSYGYWWSASEYNYNNGAVYHRYMSYNKEHALWESNGKTSLFRSHA